MKKVILFFFMLILFYNNIQSQDTSIIKYLPLKVGNSWTYRFTGNMYFPGSGYDKYTITGTTINNGHIFYNIVLTRRFVFGTLPCNSRLFYNTVSLYLDSNSGNIYRNSDYTCLLDSLKSKIRDTAIICNSSQGQRSICEDTSNITLFNVTRKTKKFRVNAFEGNNYQIFVKDIGLYQFQYTQLMTQCNFYLLGCVINGFVYGDTSLTGLIQISTEIPESFSLSQNYPNPFNPVTKIRFDIPSLTRRGAGVVVLKVYDALGREVQTLVNEHLNPGTYEVDFDGTNFASGVYYYTFSSGDPSAPLRMTKKMVLIK